MSNLVPCPSCRRHVRKHESACPFCSTELSLAHLPPPVLPRARLGRAATFTFGATLASAALIACGGESEDGTRGGGGGSSGGSAGRAGSATGGMGGNIAQPYGVPPLGGAGFGNFGGSGGQTNAGSGGSAGNGGQGSAGNGGQSTSGAGGQSNAGNGGQGGGVAPAYGIPPAGGGPVYGASPAD